MRAVAIGAHGGLALSGLNRLGMNAVSGAVGLLRMAIGAARTQFERYLAAVAGRKGRVWIFAYIAVALYTSITRLSVHRAGMLVGIDEKIECAPISQFKALPRLAVAAEAIVIAQRERWQAGWLCGLRLRCIRCDGVGRHALND